MSKMQTTWSWDLLRATLFTAAQFSDQQQLELWIKFAGCDPDQDNFQRREGMRTLSAKLPNKEQSCNLTFQPTRIDFTLAPTQANPQSDTIEDIKAFGSQIASLVSDTDISCSRLALGVVAGSSVASKIEGYQKLLALVPSLKFDPEGNISDLIFQFNRYFHSKSIPGLVLNRLMTWNVLRSILMQLPMVAGGVLRPIGEPLGFSLRLDLDLNTPQEFQGDITGVDVKRLFDEMTNTTILTLAKGERI